MNKEFWKFHGRNALVIFLAVKVIMGLQNVIYPKPKITETLVSRELETIYDLESERFSILDKTDITFLLRPRLSCQNTDMVIMALSAPNNTEKRQRLREALSDRPGVSLVFLLGQVTDKLVMSELREENLVSGDLVQISVRDHYTALSYKTLSGFIWVNRLCGNARFVVKVDDDIRLDLAMLETLLHSKYGSPGSKRPVPDTIECPSVMRNMRPWRQTHNKSLMGKWSISVQDMPRRVYPDFCPGWLYVTTPKAGLALAEVSVKNSEVLMATARLDDIFVTGFLRERLPGVLLRQLHGGVIGETWNRFLSHCPYLGITKNIFFNGIVTAKGAQGVSYINGHKFYWCAFLEYFILENLEWMFPSIETYTDPLWKVCHRK